MNWQKNQILAKRYRHIWCLENISIKNLAPIFHDDSADFLSEIICNRKSIKMLLNNTKKFCRF